MTRVGPQSLTLTESAGTACDIGGRFASSAAPIFNGKGTCIDVTTVIREALETRSATKSMPDPVQKTRTLRNVAAGAAHDLANLLVIIGIDVDVLASESLSPCGADVVRSLRAELSYLRDLARDLRMVTVDPEARDANPRTNLAAWWPDTGVLLLAVHGNEVVLRADIPPGLPGVCIESHDLTQVILNLVGNAAHAIADSTLGDNGYGHPAIGYTRGEIAISARLAGHGRAVDLTVADNGPGMSPAVLARACEPFFTTRAGRGGTGLGLAMVQRLVSDVGGGVGLHSVVGAGTTVVIELPICVDGRGIPDSPSA